LIAQLWFAPWVIARLASVMGMTLKRKKFPTLGWVVAIQADGHLQWDCLMVEFVSDYATVYMDTVSKLSDDQPCFLSRIGGSDTNAVVDLLRVTRSDPASLNLHIDKFLPTVAAYNGFYDLDNPREAYIRYCGTLVKAYLESRLLYLSNFQLLSIFFKNVLHHNFYVEDFPNKSAYSDFIHEIGAKQADLRCYPYQFVEKMVFDPYTLFRAFSVSLPGKRVAVISPFSESIRSNFSNRFDFFKKNYAYPDFQLETVDTPITYSGLPKSYYPHRNWFETLEALKAAVAATEFDVALMSCGSYAMPLGCFIEQELKRKAVYVGGVLQLYFGVVGRRYDNPFFLDQINREKFIHPLERDRYLLQIPVSETAKREAFGAYF
jgi:hypothetical protein